MTTTPARADILEVISNLSSDEVFTPPLVANAVLDLLPEEVWSDKTLRWLDPGTKTGIFLREITRRLMAGLESEIPDENERREHILKKMVFGIAITELTSLMARRSVYCSKDPDGDRSIVKMPTNSGNIWFGRVEHSFNAAGKCEECGASKDQLERGDDRENYAYGFIHKDGRDKIKEVMDMRFDVIVGNPPYQMDGGGGGTNATPLYNLFVDQAKALHPRLIAMITPSRWMAGGRGLEEFRSSMLSDRRISHITDYPDAGELFPGVEIKGGVSYFLWSRAMDDDCTVTQVRGGTRSEPAQRKLDEFDVFVRDSRALGILRSVLARSEEFVDQIVSGDTPFGLATNFDGFHKGRGRSGETKLHLVRSGARIEGWVARSQVTKNTHLVDTWKVLLPEAGSDGGKQLPDVVLGRPLVASPNSACTQTFLVAGPFGNADQAASFQSYVHTRFFRFLVSLRKISQHALRSTYAWVPQQSWTCEYTDDELYERYGISEDEQAYIAEMVKEMPE